MSSWGELLVASGLDASTAERKAALFASACASLGADPADVEAWFVPGRIEVLGKHTDYAGGRSLVCAATEGFCTVARPRRDERLRVTDAAGGGTFECSLDSERDPTGLKRAPWGAYPLAVARRVSRNFPGLRRGVDVAFVSDLPAAAGMSTSSALVIAVFLALAEVNRLARREEYRRVITGPERLAEYVASIENGQRYGPLAGDAGVGTFGGSEDHAAILWGVAGTVSQFAFAPTRLERRLPLPRGWVFAIASSGVMAQKTGAARDRYNRAALAAGQVLELWRARTGREDVSLAAAVSSGPEARERLRGIVESSDVPGWSASLLLARYDQFCLESLEIVPAAGDALTAGDVASFGVLADRSRHAAERLLGNQVPETMALARSARELGAAAASAFGAGFGGSVWALVAADAAADFLGRWRGGYLRAFPAAGTNARFFVTASGPAAFRVGGAGGVL